MRVASVLLLGGGDGRTDEGEGAGRERNLARADAKESAELSKLGPEAKIEMVLVTALLAS